MPETILPERLIEARLAMEGEERQKKRQAETQVLAKRRGEAKLAMEGRDRRLKREAAETVRHKAQNKEVAVAETAAEKIRIEQRATQSIIDTEREQTARTMAENARRREEVTKAERKIEKLKTTPVQINTIRT